jgi:hypothetical protein
MILEGCTGNEATTSDVNNKAFSFVNGAVFDPGLTNIATTLTFTNNAATFTLTSAGGIASGTVSLSPCEFTVTLSTYPAGIGPQTTEPPITLNSCDFDSSNDTLTAANATLSLTSVPATVLSTSGSVEQATVTDVNNDSFSFPNGQVFDPALINIATTLTFTNNTTTFTLTSAGGSASGTATLIPCALTVTTSTYAPGSGPQVADVVAFTNDVGTSACIWDGNNSTLTVATPTVSVTGSL